VAPKLLIEPSTLFKVLTGDRIRIIDARGRAAYERDHIPEAVCLAPAELDDSITLGNGEEVPNMLLDEERACELFQSVGIDADSTVVVYDEGGSYLASRLWWALDYFGHPDVRVLDGGMRAWRSNVGLISPQQQRIQRGSFLPIADESKTADFTYLLLGLNDHNKVVCNSLPVEEFARGAIPGSTNLPYVRTFRVTRYPVMREPEDLVRVFAQAGITPNMECIFYCGCGYSAAHNAFAARLAGFRRVRVYDGSLQDWQRRGGQLLPWGVVGTEGRST